jgi:hypothetical protein
MYVDERNYRLTQLNTRYPAYIGPGQLSSWTSPSFSGSLARDPDFTSLDPRANDTSSGGSGGGSSGFGGGSSSGGGGGTW